MGDRTFTITATAFGGSSITSEQITIKIGCPALTPSFTSAQTVPLEKGANPSTHLYEDAKFSKSIVICPEIISYTLNKIVGASVTPGITLSCPSPPGNPDDCIKIVVDTSVVGDQTFSITATADGVMFATS